MKKVCVFNNKYKVCYTRSDRSIITAFGMTKRSTHLSFADNQNTPTIVCFEYACTDNKHYVQYGAVKGSKRTRHELDMPCSLPSYYATLSDIAKQRFQHTPIESEITPLRDTTSVDQISDQEVHDALGVPHKDATMFWNHMIESFGLHREDANTPVSIESFMEGVYRQIKNQDALVEKHYSMKTVDFQNIHLFTVSYRFSFTQYSDLIVYATHKMHTQSVSSSDRQQAWKEALNGVLKNPQFLWNVPKNVYLIEYLRSEHTYFM